MEIQDEEDESALIGRRFVFSLASSFGSIIIIIRRWSVSLAWKSFLMLEWRPVLATSIEDKNNADGDDGGGGGAIKGIPSLILAHLNHGGRWVGRRGDEFLSLKPESALQCVLAKWCARICIANGVLFVLQQ